MANFTATNIAITRTEFDILTLLMRRAGRVVTRETLIDAVWGESDPDRGFHAVPPGVPHLVRCLCQHEGHVDSVACHDHEIPPVEDLDVRELATCAEVDHDAAFRCHDSRRDQRITAQSIQCIPGDLDHI